MACLVLGLRTSNYLFGFLTLHKHNGELIDKHQKTALKYTAADLREARPLLFPTSQCRGYFRTPFCETFLMFHAKFECVPVQTRSHALLKSKTCQCTHFISLMFGHLPKTSLTWGSDPLLLDASQVSIWTFSLGIGRSSSCIFVASFMMVVNTRNITVTSLSFNSEA